MAEPFRYAVVHPSGELAVMTAPDSDTQTMLDALRAAVGGYVEPITIPAGPVPGLLAWVNEDGHALGQSFNPAGLLMLHALGVRLAYPVIVGPLVFTGTRPLDPDTLTDAQIGVIRAVHREYAHVT